jgi:CheY-like chemotaxis protein
VAEVLSASATGTILCVEDNLSNLRLIERMFAPRPPVRLVATMQGTLAVDLAIEHRPAPILLDLNLPDIPGGRVAAPARGTPDVGDLLPA